MKEMIYICKIDMCINMLKTIIEETTTHLSKSYNGTKPRLFDVNINAVVPVNEGTSRPASLASFTFLGYIMTRVSISFIDLSDMLLKC